MSTPNLSRQIALAFKGPRLERILTLARYDYTKRYHGSHFGMIWALIKPIFQLTVYYFIFTGVFGAREENYALVIFLGLITWMVFSESTNRSMAVLKSKAFLIKTIQVNPVDFFISNVLTAFAGFGLALIIYVVASLVMGTSYSWQVVYMPLLLFTIFILCLGVSLILAVLNIYFQDIEQIWSMVAMFGMWTSGVFGRSEIFIQAFPPLRYINPFLAIISNIRNVMLYSASPDWNDYVYSTLYAIALLIIGLALFRRNYFQALERL
ncbi:MAG: ABC transporter permease [Cyclobacteriaceae bacterium]